MNSNFLDNRVEDGKEYSGHVSLLSRRQEEGTKTLVDVVEFNGNKYYYYSDYTQSPTIGPSMSPSMAPSSAAPNGKPMVKLEPLAAKIPQTPTSTKAKIVQNQSLPAAATASIVFGCLILVMSIGFFAYARNTRKGDEIISRAKDRITDFKDRIERKSVDKDYKATTNKEIPKRTGSETTGCEDEENRTISDHHSVGNVVQLGQMEDPVDRNGEGNKRSLSPLFIENEDPVRSEVSPPSHHSVLLTSDQFVDETSQLPVDKPSSSSRSSRQIFDFVSNRLEGSSKFIKKRITLLQKSLSPKSVTDDLQTGVMDFELCETPIMTNTALKEEKVEVCDNYESDNDESDHYDIENDHGHDDDSRSDDDFTVSNVGRCDESFVSLGLTVFTTPNSNTSNGGSPSGGSYFQQKLSSKDTCSPQSANDIIDTPMKPQDGFESVISILNQCSPITPVLYDEEKSNKTTKVALPDDTVSSSDVAEEKALSSVIEEQVVTKDSSLIFHENEEKRKMNIEEADNFVSMMGEPVLKD